MDTIASLHKINNQSFHALQFIAKNQNLFPSESIPTLLVIAAHLPHSHPPIELISEITGNCKMTIIRHLKKLEKQGVLIVTRKHRQANQYKLALGNIAVLPNNEISWVTSVLPKDDVLGHMSVTQDGFLGNIAVLPQETIPKKENIKKEKEIFDSLSRKEFVELITKHPRATDEELLHLIMARTVLNEGTDLTSDVKEKRESKDESTE